MKQESITIEELRSFAGVGNHWSKAVGLVVSGTPRQAYDFIKSHYPDEIPTTWGRGAEKFDYNKNMMYEILTRRAQDWNNQGEWLKYFLSNVNMEGLDVKALKNLIKNNK